MKFDIVRTKEDEGNVSFSAGAILGFFQTINEWFNRAITTKMRKGFDEGKPLRKLSVNIEMEFNGKKLSDEEEKELMSAYAHKGGFVMDMGKLAQHIVDDLERKKGKDRIEVG